MRFGLLQEAAMCGGARPGEESRAPGEECRGRPCEASNKIS